MQTHAGREDVQQSILALGGIMVMPVCAIVLVQPPSAYTDLGLC